MREVEICMASPGKFFFYVEKLKTKILFSVVVWGSLASVKPLLTTLCAYNKKSFRLIFTARNVGVMN